MNEEHYRRLERLYASAPINEYYRPTLTISRGEAEVAIDVRPDMFHAASAVHGSVYFKLLDDAAFFAANSLVQDVFVLTSSFNTYLLRPVIAGRMSARGRVVHESGKLYLAEAELFNGSDNAVARGSGAFVRSRIALDEKVGYL